MLERYVLNALDEPCDKDVYLGDIALINVDWPVIQRVISLGYPADSLIIRFNTEEDRLQAMTDMSLFFLDALDRVLHTHIPPEVFKPWRDGT